MGTWRSGSEPTSLALSPSGRTAYVTNWTDGTVSVVDTSALEVTSTIDLNPALVRTGYLGDVEPRAALAHPRCDHGDQRRRLRRRRRSLLVTEYFAQQIAELQSDGLNADVNKTGVVYKVNLADYAVSTITLAPIQDIGFRDVNGNPAGCFPNQLQSITLNGDYAYVTSVCAAPEGPEGLKVTHQGVRGAGRLPGGTISSWSIPSATWSLSARERSVRTSLASRSQRPPSSRSST